MTNQKLNELIQHYKDEIVSEWRQDFQDVQNYDGTWWRTWDTGDYEESTFDEGNLQITNTPVNEHCQVEIMSETELETMATEHAKEDPEWEAYQIIMSNK